MLTVNTESLKIVNTEFRVNALTLKLRVKPVTLNLSRKDLTRSPFVRPAVVVRRRVPLCGGAQQVRKDQRGAVAEATFPGAVAGGPSPVFMRRFQQESGNSGS